MILLNPGPVCLTPSVRKALTKPDICHREEEFSSLQHAIRQKLLQVYDLSDQKWVAILLAGSGTTAVEAMLSSLVSNRDKVLIIENGIYGERMGAIASIYGLDHSILHYAWKDRIPLEEVKDIIDSHLDIKYVAVVHHETTTGRLNDLEAIAAVCHQRGIALLVDGVSSFGAESLDFECWNIAACSGCSNKCLHGAPGIAFVLVRRDLLPHSVRRNLSLCLKDHCQKQDLGSTAFTQPVHIMYALEEALKELKAQGGWRIRQQQYRHFLLRIQKECQKIKIKSVIPEAETSVVLRSFYLPDNITYKELHDSLKNQGFVIYAGQGSLYESIFRVAIMGNITMHDIERFCQILSHFIDCKQPLSRNSTL